MRDIAVAVACYNNEKEVVEFAKHLSLQNSIERIQLLITCNAVRNFTEFKKEVEKALPSAIVFNPERNLGYLPGCLYGVEKSGNYYDWIMISNTDIVFQQNDFFEKALNDVRENVWCIGPDIVLSVNGVHQNPFLLERPSKRKVQIWKLAYSCYPLFWLYFELYNIKSRKPTHIKLMSGKVYAVHGSCFLLRNECVEAILKESSEIFMYGEELLVAEIVREYGKVCNIKTDSGIIHNENQVTSKVGSRVKQRWFKQSINYIDKRFFTN